MHKARGNTLRANSSKRSAGHAPCSKFPRALTQGGRSEKPKEDTLDPSLGDPSRKYFGEAGTCKVALAGIEEATQKLPSQPGGMNDGLLDKS